MGGTPLTGVDEVRDLVAATLVAAAPCEGVGAVGVELEHLPMRIAPDGRPGARLTLAELTALLDDHPALEVEPPSPTALTGWRLSDGARLVPEPGIQLEYAGIPHPTARAALAAIDEAITDLATFADTRGVALVSAGLDVWHPVEGTVQGLACPRYPAMHTYLRRRSPHGHVMMTASASIQINLDLGSPAEATSRWHTAMLAAPLATAAFACSPVPGAVNGRAVAWQWLDPTRTGIPAAFAQGVGDPVEVLLRHALAADVLLFGEGDTAHPGEPGFTFANWLLEGHPRHGRPSAHDLSVHLSTLFPEVRARGYLEIRSIDALPHRWRMVPVVLYAGLLYDPRAREYARTLLEAHRRTLPDLLRRAAHLGVADPQLCALAVEAWTAAAEGARRLPAGYLDPADISRAERFLDTFTLRGRAPSDELRERLADGPAASVRWAREPAGQMAAC